MLRLSKLGPGREAYYLQAVGIEPPGRWIGRGPGQADLAPLVEADDLTALLAGRGPATGEVLGSACNRVRVHGFDLTFAAPKSVSLLQGLADEPVAEAVSLGIERQSLLRSITWRTERSVCAGAMEQSEQSTRWTACSAQSSYTGRVGR